MVHKKKRKKRKKEKKKKRDHFPIGKFGKFLFNYTHDSETRGFNY